MPERDSDTLAIITAALAGAVIGAALAILLAPKAGEEVRGTLKKGIEDLVGKMKEVGATLKKKIEEIAEKERQKEEEAGISPEEAQG